MPKGFSMFPGRLETHRLYLLGWADGSIKIGRTRNPLQRVRQHHRLSNHSVQWAHLFPQSYSGEREEMLKDCLFFMATRVGRSETYEGITKEGAIALCRTGINGGAPALAAVIRRRSKGAAETFAREWL